MLYENILMCSVKVWCWT